MENIYTIVEYSALVFAVAVSLYSLAVSKRAIRINDTLEKVIDTDYKLSKQIKKLSKRVLELEGKLYEQKLTVNKLWENNNSLESLPDFNTAMNDLSELEEVTKPKTTKKGLK